MCILMSTRTTILYMCPYVYAYYYMCVSYVSCAAIYVSVWHIYSSA